MAKNGVSRTQLRNVNSHPVQTSVPSAARTSGNMRNHHKVGIDSKALVSRLALGVPSFPVNLPVDFPVLSTIGRKSEWILTNFEVSSDWAISCATVYSQYLRHCAESKVPALAHAYFGRLLHSMFGSQGLRRRQYATGGKIKTFYEGLRLKSNSPLQKECGADVVHATIATKPLPITVKWFYDNFTVEIGFAIKCRTTYELYLRHCAEVDIPPLSDKHFGSLLYSLFRSKGLRRHGTMCNNSWKNVYEGLRLRPDSKYHSDSSNIVQATLASTSSPEAMRWLDDYFEVDSNNAIPCRSVYHRYELCCSKQRLQPLGNRLFGRLLLTKYGASGFRRDQLGPRKGRKYFYVGLRLKGEPSGDELRLDDRIDGRWDAIKRDLSSGVALSFCHERFSQLSSAIREVEDAISLFASTLKSCFASLHGTKDSISFIKGDASFPVEYRIDKHVHGALLIGIRSICKLITSENPYRYAYVNLFKSFCYSLCNDVKEKSFGGPKCDQKQPIISDFFTLHGLRLFLNFCNDYLSSAALSNLVLAAFVNLNLINPFSKPPVNVKTEVLVATELIGYMKLRFPTLQFKTSVFVRVRNGIETKRVMDIYCPQLKLNIEIDERNHKYVSCYEMNYHDDRKSDIRRMLGDDVEFYPVHPHALTFSLASEKHRLYNFVKALAADKGHFLAEDLAPQEAPHLLQEPKAAPLPTHLRPEMVTALRESIERKLADSQRLRNEQFLECDSNSTYFVYTKMNGKKHRFNCRIDTAVEGLLVFERVSFCKALGVGGRRHLMLFACWLKKIIDQQLSTVMFAPPIACSVRRTQDSAAVETESLTTAGVLSFLNYCETTIPECADSLRQQLIELGLLCPYYYALEH